MHFRVSMPVFCWVQGLNGVSFLVLIVGLGGSIFGLGFL
ncbi:hypothetical protein [uncultured Gammaproteobacteria bacterium]|nr:hypothetical protein [uncultured Gammaproteobacteria bacterium]